MMAEYIYKLLFKTSRNISIKTFSLSVGLIVSKKFLSCFCSYCVFWVEMRYMRMSVLVSCLSYRLFIDVLATSIWL